MPSPPPLLLLLLVAAAAAAHSDHSPTCNHHHGGDHHHERDHAGHSPSRSFSGGDHHHHHHHHNHHDLDHHDDGARRKLPEELAEEEDLELYGFEHHGHHEHRDGSDLEPSALGLWLPAMGCSLLVSLASLICLIILPVIFVNGKPSKAVVDSLAVFGAGAMLGDAFLHQLPHAFGGQHHEHHMSGLHDHHEHGHSHAHSLKELSVGLSILFGIVIFLLVEKVVRYVDDHTCNGAKKLGYGSHHHHHKLNHKLHDDNGNNDTNSELDNSEDGDTSDGDKADMASEKKLLGSEPDGDLDDEKHHEQGSVLRKRVTSSAAVNDDKKDDVGDGSLKKSPSDSSLPSSLVFGYLNLFSDGVHNFTDGMALGSAFLLHGTVGGWSRTLFLLAHELPQEVGDFGILVRSGFTVSKALFFNFLSALVALAGTALALLLGKDPGQSSLIEGFTAGGFIYIAVAGVLPEMNNEKTTLKSTAVQLTSLILGMLVALCISLVE